MPTVKNAMPAGEYKMPTELEDRVRHTEHQVGSLFGHVQRHGEILTDHSGKLDRILSVVSSSPKFDPLRILQFLALAVAIVGALGTAITYVATSTNSARLAVIEFKAEQMWTTGEWVPVMPSVKGNRLNGAQ